MSDDVNTAATIAHLREQVESLQQSIVNACDGSGCVNAHELRAALDTARERAGVLEAEVRAWRASFDEETGKQVGDSSDCRDVASCRCETDRRNALDAAKFGGAELARNQPCGCVVCKCDDERCHGCGAKHCGTHPVGEIPNPKFGGA